MGRIAGQSNGNGAASTSVSLTLPTLTGSALRLGGALIVSASVTGLSITVGGAAVSVVLTSPTANGRAMVLFEFVGPVTGDTVACSWTGDSLAWLGVQVCDGRAGLRAGALSDAGLSAADPLTLTVPSAADDDVLDFCAAGFATMTPGAGQSTGFTEVLQNTLPLNGSAEVAAGATTVMSWDIGGAVGEWFYHAALAFTADAGGPPPDPPLPNVIVEFQAA